MLVFVLLLGCGTDGPIRSLPTTPTLTFPVVAAGILWTDLETVFPEAPASLPEGVAALALGMTPTAAQAVLEAGHEPGVKLFREPRGDVVVMGSMLAGYPTVGVTVVIRNEALEAVDVSVPNDVAIPMLTTRWGPPTQVVHGNGGVATYAWEGKGRPWRATLHPAPADAKADAKAVIKFEAPRG